MVGDIINRRGALSGAVLFSLSAAAIASAQVTDVQPYYALVTTDKAVMRSGENDRFYKVGEIDAGTILVVDGDGQSWSRVSYPAHLGAFVRVEDIEVVGQNARLTQPSKLKAANIVTGYDGSWKSLLATPLPAGTTLKIIEPAKEGDGPVVGYRVAVPESARGFIESRSLRRANDSEIQSYKAKGAALATLPAAKPTTTAATPAPTPTPLSNPAKPAETPKPVTIADPIVPPPAATPETTPAVEVADKPQTPASQRRIGSIEELEAALQEVWKQPILTAELDELIAEYERAIANTNENSPSYGGLSQRLAALKVRQDYRNKTRALEEAKAKLDAGDQRLAAKMKEFEKGRVYTIIGQLQPSTVYDGKRLPQMFRVVSVGGTAPRTLGYLKKSSEIDLEKMLGQVVGVIGEATLDRSLMLNIITPIHVDQLKSDGQSGSTTEEPTEPAETGTKTSKADTSDGK